MTQGMEKGMTKGMETDEIIVRCGTISMGQIHNELVHKYRILVCDAGSSKKSTTVQAIVQQYMCTGTTR